MLVSVPKDRSQDLIQSVKGIEGMNTSCFVTDDPNAVTASPKVGCKYIIYWCFMVQYHTNCIFFSFIIVLYTQTFIHYTTDSGYFTLSGADHPGIVHKVTQVLVKHRLNIDKMKTHEESAPYGGTTLFFMNGIATSPAPLANGFDPSLIKAELQQLGEEMNCDIDLEDVHDDEYSASFYAG